VERKRRPERRHAERELRVLREVAEIAAAEQELRPLLQRICRRVRRLCRLEVVACATVEADRGVLVC
jgi:hypothetical protein